jgi:transcriptional regulator with XRE-family HTH domain
MRITPQSTDQAVLRELGARVAQTRLEQNLSQHEVAGEAGVGLATLKRLEAGRPVRLDAFVRVLRTVGLLEALDRAVPEPTPSPIQELKLRGRRRRRAGTPRKRTSHDNQPGAFRWGDERVGDAQ